MDLFLAVSDKEINLIQWGAVIGASLIAASSDLKTRRIPNALTFPLFLAGLAWSIFNNGLSGLGEAFLACLLLGVPYVLLFLFAGGGAGDAKLMAAIGTWLGIRQSAVVLLCVASAGIVMALIRAISKRKLRFVLTSVAIWLYTFIISVAGGRKPKVVEEQPEDARDPNELEMPYGIAICAGVLLAAIVVWKVGVEWLW